LASLLASLVGCTLSTDDGDSSNPKEASTESTSVPVEVAALTRGPLQAIYAGTATLQAEADAEVVARVAGQVMGIQVEEGARVVAGQVLASLDPRQLRLQALQARAQLAKLERDYRRQTELSQKGLIAVSTLDGLRFDLDHQRASVELANLQLAYTDIRAPFAGVVAVRHIKVGQNLQQGALAFRVTNPTPLKAQVFVPERELARLKLGQSASVQVDALPGRQFNARVSLVAPTIDAATATFKVTLLVDDTRAELKPGMFARIAIVFDRKNDAWSIPRVALLEGEDTPRIFVVKDGKAHAREVALGLSEGAQVELLTPLPADTQVVVVGQNGLKDGNSVKVVSLETPARAAG
jgi:membrane fusion protein (multidrug efflux system)